MKFTDEDLSNLTVFIKSTTRTVGTDFIEEANLKALLYRLECAEAHLKACEEYHGFDQNDMPFVKAWLASKGETEAGV